MYLLFGGAMGGGKSYFLCGEAIKNAMRFAGNRLVIVRKELSVLRRTILVTFRTICPPEIIKNFNQTTLEVTFINGSVLTFIDANISKDPLLQKIKGLEIGWFGIDEANEVSKEVYSLLKTRLRWVLPNKTKPRYEGRLTSNPEACWLIPTFIQSDSKEEMYIQSLTTDNYREDDPYVKNLMEAFKDNPNMLRKYLYGDWSLIDSINQLIPSEALFNAREMTANGGRYLSMGIDVARYGDDKTVFTILKEGNIVLQESYPYTSTVEVATRAIQLIDEYKIHARYVGIDSIGVGAGVVDILKAQHYNVTELQGGAKPAQTYYQQTFKAFNLRSQMYYQLSMDIKDGKLGNLSHESLRLELQAIQYEIAGDKTVRVASKDIIKKILGNSPDYADSLVYANWVKVERTRCPVPLPILGRSSSNSSRNSNNYMFPWWYWR